MYGTYFMLIQEGVVYLQIEYLNKDIPVYVAVYARVSTEHEAQISALENQIQYYDNILKDHPNWILVERYIDKGITGTSMQKRDSFMRMMKDASENKFNLILTREVSRFARNTADTLQQVRVLMGYNVGVYFVEDHIWTFGTDDDWELKLSLMATLAQNESRKISSRVKAGQNISFQNGVPYGNGNILGYNRVGKEMVINEEQAATVKRIFELYLSGKGLRSIKFILEQEGRKTSYGKTKWAQEVISRVLKNEFYTGTIVYQKQIVPDYLVQKKVTNTSDNKPRVEGKHVPIISKEDFEKVQEIMESKTRKTQSGRNVGHAISKDAYCRKLICTCGRTFNKRRNYVSKTGEQRYIYQCYDQLRHGTLTTRINKGLDTKDACTSMTLPNWKLDVVSDWLFRKFFDNKQLIFEKVMGMLEEASDTNLLLDDIDEDIEKNIDFLKKTEHRLSALIDLYTDGDIPKEMYLAKKSEAEEKLENTKNVLNELHRKRELIQESTDAEERKKRISDFLMVKSFQQQSRIPDELIDYYIHSIEVDNEKMTWVLKIPYDENGKQIIPVYDKSKKKFTPLTPKQNQVLCAMLPRLQSAKHVNNQEVPQTLINLGVYYIPSSYARSIKKHYFEEDSRLYTKDIEVCIKLCV